MPTVFTQIIRRELPARIVWENDRFICFLPKDHFVNVGHLLLVPKVEVDEVFALDEATYAELWLVAKALAGPLQEVTGAARIGIAVEGFSVPHAHVHLCPVNAVAELDPHRDVAWPEAARDRFVAELRPRLAGIA